MFGRSITTAISKSLGRSNCIYDWMLKLKEMLITYREELSLPLLEAKQFEDAFTAMLLLLTSIAEHFLVDRLFNITQKAHFLQHCSILSRFLNPRLTWCFQGEDMQKRMSGLAKACVNGQRPGQTIAKMISRYRLALHLGVQQRRLNQWCGYKKLSANAWVWPFNLCVCACGIGDTLTLRVLPFEESFSGLPWKCFQLRVYLGESLFAAISPVPSQQEFKNLLVWLVGLVG